MGKRIYGRPPRSHVKVRSMIRITQLKMNPAQNRSDLVKMVRNILRLREDEPCSVEIIRQSVDARRKPDIYYVYTVHASLKDEKTERRVLKHIRVKNAEYVITGGIVSEER